MPRSEAKAKMTQWTILLVPPVAVFAWSRRSLPGILPHQFLESF